ncbi:hypothetical protein [Desulfolucanica intricata]|uniref:hypothetical protein n=1 Tax=Desulfolucanica intricata TaxID=1285191 RepID=UPI000831482F|nr:hypothetical protein [Desulfolucanica intricata]
MPVKFRETNFLYAYTEINNLEMLETELIKFRDMIQSIRKSGFLYAAKFEYKLLLKAIEKGPEHLAQVLRQITSGGERKKLRYLAEQAQKFLPYADPKTILSDWELKQINCYSVKGKLNCECEIKLNQMIRFMIEIFMINAMIKAAGDESEWGTLVDHLRKNLISLNNLEKHLG